MGLDRSGTLDNVAIRSNVTGDDTAWPAAGTGALVPGYARGSITHVRVVAVGSTNAVQCRVTLLGALTSSTNAWNVLAQVNDGAAITRTTKVPVANENNIYYLETFAHISAMHRIHALIDATAGLDTSATGGVTVELYFERP